VRAAARALRVRCAAAASQPARCAQAQLQRRGRLTFARAAPHAAMEFTSSLGDYWPPDAAGWPGTAMNSSLPGAVWDLTAGRSAAVSSTACSDHELASLLFDGALAEGGGQEAAPPVAPAAAAASAAASGEHGALRCLDVAHDAACTRCTPAPADEDCALFMLRRDLKGACHCMQRYRAFSCAAPPQLRSRTARRRRAPAALCNARRRCSGGSHGGWAARVLRLLVAARHVRTCWLLSLRCLQAP
jgi:hypothetical protein